MDYDLDFDFMDYPNNNEMTDDEKTTLIVYSSIISLPFIYVGLRFLITYVLYKYETQHNQRNEEIYCDEEFLPRYQDLINDELAVPPPYYEP